MSVLELRDVQQALPARIARVCRRCGTYRWSSHSGEMVGIWGHRHSGRSTLLARRGRPRARRRGAGVRGRTGSGARGSRPARGRARSATAIRACSCARRTASGRPRELVLGTLMVAQVARGVGTREARRAVLAALARTGAEHCAELRIDELDGARGRARHARARARARAAAAAHRRADQRRRSARARPDPRRCCARWPTRALRSSRAWARPPDSSASTARSRWSDGELRGNVRPGAGAGRGAVAAAERVARGTIVRAFPVRTGQDLSGRR